jgi:phage protein D
LNARRTEIDVKINGVNVTADINDYLQSLTFTDTEDETDDLQIQLDDREGFWLEWLGAQTVTAAPAVPVQNGDLSVGDTVQFLGGSHFHTSMDTVPVGGNRTAGAARITHLANGALHPIHVIGVEGGSNVYGWVDRSQIAALDSPLPTASPLQEGGNSRDIKGATISARIISSDSGVLDCGEFEIDSAGYSGPPAKVNIRATSLPYSSTVRNTTNSRMWENIQLSAIGNEIAAKHGLTCMFFSASNPTYSRREQMAVSDVVFLEGLCRDSGISLKITDRTIVFFDEQEFEQRASVYTIKKGSSDVLSWRLNTAMNETRYGACRVSYTDPNSGATVDYTFTPHSPLSYRHPPSERGALPVLEVNEKVDNLEEAMRLAPKRLREKNKHEYQASFTLVGDVRIVAGVTVELVGWGFYDGKYIVERAVHSVSGGYTVAVTLHRALEGY